MMKSIFILLFFLLLSLNNFLFSQTPPYYHYTTIDGLASSTVYEVIQSKSGYIWFATANGISRFDGHRFKNYGIDDGLNSNSIISILEGSDGEIYIANYDKGINILKEGRISSYAKSDDKIVRFNYLFLEKNILIGYGPDGVFTFNNGNAERINVNPILMDESIPVIVNQINKTYNGSYIASTSHGLYKIINKNFKRINIDGFNNTEIYCVNESRNGVLLAGSKGKLFQIRNNNITKVINTEYPDEKISIIFSDSRGNIWFSIINRGFYMIPFGSEKIFDIGSKLKLQKALVNDFLEDNEGNIWVSTLGKGVFCLNNFQLNNYTEEDGLISNSVQAIEKDNSGRIILGTMNGVNILDDGKFEMLYAGTNRNLTDYIYEMKSIGDKVYVCSAASDYSLEKIYNKGTEFNFFLGVSFCQTKENKFLIGHWANQIYTNIINTDTNINNNQYFPAIGEEIKTNRINEIFEDSDSNLWIGTTLGLCKIRNNMKKYFPENEILNTSIKSIIQDNQKKIWFAGEKGIASYNLLDSSVSSFKNIAGHDLSSSSSLAVDKYNRIWVGNIRGIFILTVNSIKHINSLQGLPSDEVLTLFSDKEKNIMWIGTNNGFSSFDINFYDQNKPPSLNIQIDKIKIGDSLYTKFNNPEFENTVNDIHIDFSAINFSSPTALKYQYKFNGDWINSENDFIDFKSLEHGKYNISFRAKTQNGEWSKPFFLSFTVKPKFTDTILFKLLIFVFIAGIIIVTVKYKVNSDRKKRAIKSENSKKMHELEHQALSAMMNPHFIFNSLNSVQYLVNKGRNDEANDYISILAKLIRKNLDTAGDSYILLDEEISRLTYYLEIEKLRFQDKFYYEIIAGEDVDIESVLIPNMILQPFVENAVWYGIMNMGKKGFVKISFRFENVNIDSNTHRCLVIKIKDNGIGLKKSGEIKKEGHISKGIKIIEERLKLLSQELEIPTPLIIEDLSLRNENSTGTEVIITLPDTLYRIII